MGLASQPDFGFAQKLKVAQLAVQFAVWTGCTGNGGVYITRTGNLEQDGPGLTG